MKPRRNASMENAKCYAPQILVGTEGLPREQWLEYRRKGIGGSDAAAVLGISPFGDEDIFLDLFDVVPKFLGLNINGKSRAKNIFLYNSNGGCRINQLT